MKSKPSPSPDIAPSLNLQVPGTSPEAEQPAKPSKRQPPAGYEEYAPNQFRPIRKDAPPATLRRNPDTGLVEIIDPAWEGVRQTIQAVRATGRAYLFGQAWLGWQLAMLKKQHGVAHGSNKTPSGQFGRTVAWDKIVEHESGLSRRTADRFIALFEATQAKLKRKKKGAPANPNALALFKTENPLALPPEQREALQDVIASLCDGETQASLMQELGVVPKPPPMPKGGLRGDGKYSVEQLAFDFFEGPASAIMRARANKDYKKLLYILPAVTDQEGKVSLVMLRDETQAMLDDIHEAMAKHAKPAKPAKGKTTNP